jgi:hypothetical protein
VRQRPGSGRSSRARAGWLSRTAAAIYLSGVLGDSTARSSRLGDGVSDRSAVLQSVAEVDHLVAVVFLASFGGTRRRWEAVPLLPQPQRVHAYVEHRGGLVDCERGSTLLLRMYRLPGSIPLAPSGIADGCRMGAAPRRSSGTRTRPDGSISNLSTSSPGTVGWIDGWMFEPSTFGPSMGSRPLGRARPTAYRAGTTQPMDLLGTARAASSNSAQRSRLGPYRADERDHWEPGARTTRALRPVGRRRRNQTRA